MTQRPRRPGRPDTDASRPSRGDRVEAAYNRLREFIISGRLAPGSRIIETDIAERLGVSRTPVRAALQRLRQDGFIVAADHTSQARLWVAPLSRTDARELFGILSLTEGLGAGWTAERPAEERTEVVERLRELNGRLEERGSAERPDSHELFAIDQDLHAAFFNPGAGPRLKALHGSIKPQSERYLLLYLNALVDRVAESVREHHVIIGAIERGDPAASQEAVSEHWRAAGRRLDAVMERLGERGVW